MFVETRHIVQKTRKQTLRLTNENTSTAIDFNAYKYACRIFLSFSMHLNLVHASRIKIREK